MDEIRMNQIAFMIFAVAFLSISNVFAETDSELQREAGGILDQFFDWIYSTSDEAMEQVDVPDNELNFTNEEAHNIYESGKEVTDAGVDFLRKSHHLSGDLAEGALPFPIHPDVLFLLGLIVIAGFLIFRHKKLMKDIIFIAFGIIVLAVILFILQLNLS